MIRQSLGLLVALVLLAGCARSRLTFEPTPARADVSAEEVAAGDRLYPFRMPSGQWGYMDATGDVILDPRFQSAEAFSEGRAAVQVGDVYGYIDPSGEIIVPAQYASAAPFSQGRALVTDGPQTRPRYGFIDPGGTVVVPIILPQAYSYSEGRALVRVRDRDLTLFERILGVWRNESLGFIDLDGEIVFYVPGESASFSEGLAPFSQPTTFSSGRWGYLRPDGSVAIEADFRRTAFRFSDGLARVVHGEGIGFIDATGGQAFEPTFEVAQAFSDGLAAVLVDGQWGYIDESGALTIPPRFEEAAPFAEGLAAVRVGGQWGYIDAAGQTVIEPTFASAQSFRGPLAFVVDGTGPHYIDRQGRPVRPDIPPR